MSKDFSITGYSHPQCYANQDKDCSRDVSNEHPISQVLLRRIQSPGAVSKIAGLSWQTPQTFDRVLIKDLAAKILCERHNSRLSRLDALIGDFADAIRDIDRDVRPKTKPVKIDGLKLEHWALKCLIGLVVSGSCWGRLKPECVSLLFERRNWPEGWGLYFDVTQRQIYHTDDIAIETMTASDGLILAAKFFTQGLPFTLILGRPDDPRAWGVWRPANIKLRGSKGDAKIVFRWGNQGSSTKIQITKIGTYDGHPLNWAEWERNG